MRGFYIILTSLIALVHFWRLPYLIMENGGGAFLILYLLSLFGLALPVFIAEMTFESSFGQRRSSDFMLRVENFKNNRIVQALLSQHLALQIVIWFGLFQYFLFISSLSLIHFYEAATGSLQSGGGGFEASLEFRLAVTGLLFVGVGLTINRRIYSFLIWLSRRALPLCLAIFVVILFQILSVGSNVEGVKTMLYPDFFRLRWESLLEVENSGRI